MTEMLYDFGMVGLGTMGSALLLNIAEHGHRVAGYDLDPSKVAAFEQEGAHLGVKGFTNAAEFAKSLIPPRPIMILVPAGPAVDSVIKSLLPVLQPGDFLIDGGNSFYKDTDRRNQDLIQRGFGFLGMGVSGGESGARNGPSMMPGGTAENFERVRPILESIAAKYDDQPCVALVGSGSAGHYVKTVHNGIEYAMMQLIAEAYDLMRRGLAMPQEEIADVVDGWVAGPFGGFLLEITARVLRYRDEEGTLLVDVISDKAKAKGTGKWTSQDAMDLGVPVPTIDAAVTARMLSAQKSERLAASAAAPKGEVPVLDRMAVLASLEGALHAAMLLSYSQGLSLIKVASQEYGYGTNLETVARIWRAGCIIRSKMLEPIRAAFARDPELKSLLLDPGISDVIRANDDALRGTVATFAGARIPAPCFSASLAYLDSYRSVRLPANLIQAQRDLFGAHTFERLDREGTFHSTWGED